MVKSYLKFEQSSVFGQICGATSNTVFLPTTPSDRSTAGRAVVGANEDVLVWDVKRGEVESRWHVVDNRSQVTVICRSHTDPDIFAVGYNDGKIRLWDSKFASVLMTFNGHRSAVTQLQFDRSGYRLASGGRDTDIIVWDIVNEVGLFKLRGHKNQITSLSFLSSTHDTADPDDYLLSTSKDALIKVWDLSTQHCIETQVTQSNGECWALGLSPDRDGCVTAGNDGEMKVWVIDKEALSNASEELGLVRKILKDRGTFYRAGKDRTTAVLFHPKRDIVALHGSEKSVELWRIRSEDEVRKSITRKRKRKREKLGEDAEMDESPDATEMPVTEVFVQYVIVRTGGRVRSIDWAGGKSTKSLSLLVAGTNNQLEMYDVVTKESKKDVPDYNRTVSVDLPGHRTDIRCLALSSDDRMLASASHGSLKIWNTRTQSCLRTLECGYALCAAFLPGDKIVVVGTRDGKLEIFDIASSSLLDTIDAHERDIWSLHLQPDGKSIVTASADKCAKFWDLKVVQAEVLGTTRTTPRLTLVHTRTLKTADDILAVRFSPDGRYLALSTLDTTVKVFYTDSLKLYLTLYGHKLPVLSLDISHDSKLVVTSSADKTVRVWGLDFGDCHKTFFAHNDSILTVGFIPNNADGNGHHFFSASKDSVIKYWDGDKFEQIQKLDGHHNEIWAMAVAHSGQLVATASHDKTIRLWTQTSEQIFLEEEREKELEEMYENTLLTSLDQQDGPHDSLDSDDKIEASNPSKQSSETLIASEKITEALTLGMTDLAQQQAYTTQLALHTTSPNTYPRPAPPSRHPIYLAAHSVSAQTYLSGLLSKLPPSHLQDTLLLLSFSQLPSLLIFLALIADDHPRSLPLVSRVLNFMLKTHHRQIVSSQLMKPELSDLCKKLRKGLETQRREVGFNLAGLRVVGRQMQLVGQEDLWVDGEEGQEEERKREAKGGVKRSFVNIA